MQTEFWFAFYLLAANIPMNIYPILLQRYTRARLERMKERIGCERKRPPDNTLHASLNADVIDATD